MTNPNWSLLPKVIGQEDNVVTRVWPDGKQESRLVSSFTPNDDDYAAIMLLVEEEKLTIVPTEL